jgi:hypothetical protein
MTKATMQSIADKYNMTILRQPITREAFGVMVETDDLIPELDAIVDEGDYTVSAVRELYGNDTYRYRIFCPTDWFDLWGWK